MSWHTSQLCTVGELAGGGPVAVAVGVSDRGHMAGLTDNLIFFWIFSICGPIRTC